MILFCLSRSYLARSSRNSLIILKRRISMKVVICRTGCFGEKGMQVKTVIPRKYTLITFLNWLNKDLGNQLSLVYRDDSLLFVRKVYCRIMPLSFQPNITTVGKPLISSSVNFYYTILWMPYFNDSENFDLSAPPAGIWDSFWSFTLVYSSALCRWGRPKIKLL